MSGQVVMVNGVGNIGTTLLQVLAHHRELLGIEQVIARKSTVRPWDVAALEQLAKLGVTIVADAHPGERRLEDVQGEVTYVMDATAAGGARRNKPFYETMPALVGASGQGSETGFGRAYALGFGIDSGSEKYTHVVSCSTHAALCVLRTLTRGRLEDVVSADFVNVRRSEDIGNHERLVSGNVISRHLDDVLGTHHAIDADQVLAVVGRQVPMQSSDITTPSQFMHSSRFSVRLRKELPMAEVQARIEQERWAASTVFFDTNKVFETGRRFGFAGRLYNQAVFVPGNLLVKGDTVAGWAFVPQEGNTVLSTVSAFLQRTHPEPDAALDELASALLIPQL